MPLPVIAVLDGVIVRSDNSNPGGYGNVVDIRYPDGTVHRMAHLADRNVQVGDSVAAGTVLGTMGNTGNAAGGGVHLHYEVIDGSYYDSYGGRPPGRGTEGRIDPSEWWFNSSANAPLPVAGSDFGGWDDVPRSGGNPNSRWFGGPRGTNQTHAGIDIYYEGEDPAAASTAGTAGATAGGWVGTAGATAGGGGLGGFLQNRFPNVWAFAEGRGFLPNSQQSAASLANGEEYWPTLRPGMGYSGNPDENVQELQSWLNDNANANLEVDGIFGDRTRQALMNYQSRQGLQVDGIAGPETQGSIAQVSRRRANTWEAVRRLLPFNGRLLDRIGAAMGFNIPGASPIPEAGLIQRMMQNADNGRTTGQTAEEVIAEAADSHTVARGDTLWDIAQENYGDPQRWRDIAAANGINPEDPTIQPGQRLILPPMAPTGNTAPTPAAGPAGGFGQDMSIPPTPVLPPGMSFGYGDGAQPSAPVGQMGVHPVQAAQAQVQTPMGQYGQAPPQVDPALAAMMGGGNGMGNAPPGAPPPPVIQGDHTRYPMLRPSDRMPVPEGNILEALGGAPTPVPRDATAGGRRDPGAAPTPVPIPVPRPSEGFGFPGITDPTPSQGPQTTQVTSPQRPGGGPTAGLIQVPPTVPALGLGDGGQHMIPTNYGQDSFRVATQTGAGAGGQRPTPEAAMAFATSTRAPVDRSDPTTNDNYIAPGPSTPVDYYDPIVGNNQDPSYRQPGNQPAASDILNLLGGAPAPTTVANKKKTPANKPPVKVVAMPIPVPVDQNRYGGATM